MNNRTAHITRAAILAALPGTQFQIHERTGFGKATISRHLADMRYRREVRIAGWSKRARGPGPYLATYDTGSTPDAVCDLQPVPASIRLKAYRKQQRRIRQRNDRQDREALMRARASADKASYRADPIMAALFGARA